MAASGVLVLGATFAAPSPAIAQTLTVSDLAVRISALQNEMARRMTRVEDSLRLLTDLLERTRRETSDGDRELRALVDEARYQLADIRALLESGGAPPSVAGGAPAVAGGAPVARDGSLGVIRAPVDAQGRPILSASVAMDADGAVALGAAGDTASPDPDPLASLFEAIEAGSTQSAARRSADEIYESAYVGLRDGFYEAAVAEFGEFIEGYPDDPRIAAAKFWIGEAHFATNNAEDAVRAYLRVIREHPDDVRSADSLFRTGVIFAREGKTREACVALRQVEDFYPNAPERLRNRAHREAELAGCA